MMVAEFAGYREGWNYVAAGAAACYQNSHEIEFNSREGNCLWKVLYSLTSSETTLKCFKLATPKAVVRATSEASRPVAMRARPMRG
jgi:hypothetical protein